jgi:uncharacterized protein (TIGR02722 family)
MKKFIFILASVILFSSCSQFKAERQSAEQSDEKALSITDNWLDKDTNDTVQDIIKQINEHKGFQRFQAQHQGKPALFIAEIQNRTAEAYFPIDDLNNELLNEMSKTDDFVLVDAAARDKLLEEIKYQNDGMVDPATAKSIGKQTGADLLIFGSVQMKPEMRDGKTVKQYSIDIRLTNLEKAVEVARTRSKVYKFSEKKTFGF